MLFLQIKNEIQSSSYNRRQVCSYLRIKSVALSSQKITGSISRLIQPSWDRGVFSENIEPHGNSLQFNDVTCFIDN